MKPTSNFPLLKAIRQLDTTQGRVARQSDISEPRFTRILRGYVQATEREVERICKALDRSRVELGFESARNPE
jgi:predicted transcriptional regulator